MNAGCAVLDSRRKLQLTRGRGLMGYLPLLIPGSSAEQSAAFKYSQE